MPIQHSLWTVSVEPVEVASGRLPSEQMLEDMIVAQPRILSSEWMLIGRQVDTGSGGRIDLLAIAPDGSLVVVERKRDRSPREVVAQALDYAAWVEGLDAEAVNRLYARFRPGASLATDFAARFGQSLSADPPPATQLPLARDGTCFHAGPRRAGYFTIGEKGDGRRIGHFSEALQVLRQMAVPRWRRLNDHYNWGIVSGVRWERADRLGITL